MTKITKRKGEFIVDKEISKDLFEVENPVYQDFDDIMEKYFGNRVVITNEQPGESGSGKLCKGGIVRYYANKYSKDIYNKWGECLSVDEYEPAIIIGLFPSNPL